MRAWLRRLREEGEDWLRYQPFVRNRLADWQCWREARRTPRDHQERARAIRALCSAARLSNRPALVDRCLARIAEHVAALDVRAVDWSEFVADLAPHLAMSELIKEPVGDREKGILYVPFEVEWARLMVNADLAAVARRYHLILGPSSSPHNLVNHAFAHAWAAPLFTLISNPEDLAVLPRIGPRFHVVELYASSWVDPDLYSPRPRQQRDLDLVMVAGWGKVKRHHALLRVLRRMPRALRVHLIGQDSEGRTTAMIRRLVASYGVADRVTVQENATHAQVRDTLCRARASIILSRREGSCLVIAESLFADTPAALLRGAEIGSRVFINDQTGRFLDESDLAAQLTDFLAQAHRCEPRAWAEAHISCTHSLATLNEAVKRHALAAGEQWTVDLTPFARHPFPRVRQDHLAAARQEFRERFGITIGSRREEAR